MRKKNDNPGCLILITIAVLIAIVGTDLLFPWGKRIYENGMDLKADIIELQNLRAKGLKADKISDYLDVAKNAQWAGQNLTADLGPLFPIFARLGWMPFAGPYFASIEPALDYLDSLTRGIILVGENALPLMPGREDSVTTPEGLVAYIKEKQPTFEAARDLLAQAEKAGERINPLVIPAQYTDDFKKLNEDLNIAPEAFDAMGVVIPLLGDPKPRTYLIVVQNRDELRPSGGFITAFGLLRLDEGHVTMLEVDDSTPLNYVKDVRKPPLPLEKILMAPYLVARDSNWSPDFPTAARDVQDMYFNATSIPTDGVIAFDQGLIVRLVDLIGPVNLNDGSAPLTVQNVEARMVEERQKAIDEGHPKDRKDFMAILGPALVERMYAVRGQQVTALASLLAQSMREGHLLVYVNVPAAEALVTRAGLDNAVNPGAGDFLMPVDANLGYSKNDLYIERTLRYIANLTDPAAPVGEVTLQYTHTKAGSDPCHMGVSHSTDPNLRSYYFSRCYWNYFRLFIPAADVPRAQNVPDVPPEYYGDHPAWPGGVAVEPGVNSTQSLGALLVVPQAQTRSAGFTLGLPPTVTWSEGNSRVYHLRVQKQPGIEKLNVEINVVPPAGMSAAVLPAGWVNAPDGKSIAWKGVLRATTDFELRFAPAGQ
jgi:hypothetical protein